MTRAVLAGVFGCCCVVLGLGCDRFKGPSQADAPPLVPQESKNLTSITITAPAVSEAETVARVDGTPISLHDYTQWLDEVKLMLQAQDIAWTPPTVEEQKNILEQLVNYELMARDSSLRGITRDPEVQRRLWYLQRRMLSEEWRRREEKAARVTPQEIDKFYDDYKAYLRVPAELRVRQITVLSQAETRTVLKQILDGVDVATLAKQVSKAPNAASGGDLGTVVRDVDKRMFGPELGGTPLFPEAENVVFALDAGGVSQIVKGPGVGGATEAYYIYQVVSQKPEQQRALNEVRDQIEARLKAQKMDDKIKELRTKAVIATYEERLKTPKP